MPFWASSCVLRCYVVDWNFLFFSSLLLYLLPAEHPHLSADIIIVRSRFLRYTCFLVHSTLPSAHLGNRKKFSHIEKGFDVLNSLSTINYTIFYIMCQIMFTYSIVLTNHPHLFHELHMLVLVIP